MRLHFVDTVSARDAKHACMNEHGGLIITSHSGCNNEGERKVYKVHSVDVSSDEFSLELFVTEAKFKEAFSHFNIDFGYTNEGHHLRRHEDFQKVRKRQESSKVMDPATITAAPVAIPSDTAEDKTAASFDLSFQTLNSTFAPKDFLSPIQDVVAIPDLPVELGCNNCTTTGALSLTQGAFDIDLGNIDVLPDFIDGDSANVLSFIKSGFIELAVKDLSAHIDLFAKPKASGQFEVSLPSLPIVGFTIPGIGKAGVSFNASLQATYEVKGGVEVQYGFDVLVPADSTVRVDLSDFGKSGITGFDAPKVDPLPFTANVTDVEITVGLKFRPTIPVGFDFLDGQLEAQVSVFMDLPSIQGTLSTQAGQTCSDTPSNFTTPSNSTDVSDSPLGIDIGSFVLLDASIGVALGVGANFKVPALPPNIGAFQTAFMLFETEFNFPTACIDA
ncbi:hypothetical protein EJ04DRAFT_404095, partial [Polyplosphaeria fusca]